MERESDLIGGPELGRRGSRMVSCVGGGERERESWSVSGGDGEIGRRRQREEIGRKMGARFCPK
jgi:hypothetical protein